jgi:hypothetical protein
VTRDTRPRAADRGSTLRLLIGSVLILTALATTVIGFVRLIRVLEAGGYGTSAMRNVLIILALAGAMLAAGIATIIWDIAKRYEHP